MGKRFRMALFGYQKKQVNQHLLRITNEYEDELAAKNERLVSLRDENNFLKNELTKYKGMEREISSVLIAAQSKAKELIVEGERSAESEKARLMEELRQLDSLTRAIYARIETTLLQAADCARGFEEELAQLKLRKEVFLKESYEFSGEGGEERKRIS